MFKFVSHWLDRTGLSRLFKLIEYNQYMMLFIALMGFAAVCFMSYTGASAGVEDYGIYQVAWVGLSSLALILLYRSGIYAEEMSSSRTFLAVMTILVHLYLVEHIFMLHGFLDNTLPFKVSQGQMLLLMPWMLAPAVVSVLIGRRMGMFSALATSLLGLALLPITSGIELRINYLVISMLVGTLSAMLAGRVSRREKLLYAGFTVGVVVFGSCFALGCLQPYTEAGFNARILGGDFLCAMAMSFVVAIFINGALPLLERLFNLCTPMTWLELGDRNHVLLKRLQMEAPGTYTHSNLVASLSEAAAEAIGANPTHSSVCALFHDIGKLTNPGYFAENISDGCINPHDELTPDTSVRIITNHVQDGVELALEHRLNNRITNVIREHHGKSSAYFFLRKAQDAYDADLKRFEEGLIDTKPKPVDKEDFCYKGPLPQTRESGIVSLADAAESATRSLKQPTEQEVLLTINNIIKSRILDGHLAESRLTLGDLEKIKDSFFATIKSLHHNRIAYPKPKPEEEEEAAAAESKQEPQEEAAAEEKREIEEEA